MQFAVDETTRRRIEEARELGEKEIRPVGLEADRNGAPIPVGHPFFDRCLARGGGRTRWRRPDAPAKEVSAPQSTVTTLLLAEELAYWDRGVIIAMPGPGRRCPKAARRGSRSA